MNSHIIRTRLLSATRKACGKPFISRKYYSFFRKMKPRNITRHGNGVFLGAKKQPVGKNVNQTNLHGASVDDYDKEFPPISMSNGKKIDLGTPLEQKSVEAPIFTGLSQNAASSTKQQDENLLPIDLGTSFEQKSVEAPMFSGLSQNAASSTRQQDENLLPTSFGKKHGPYGNRRPKYLRGEEPLDQAEKHPVIYPFDICFPGNSMENKIQMEYPIIEERKLLGPGLVLLTNYISLGEQVQIINKCRELGLGPGGFYQPGYQNGAKLRLRMMCLGKKWNPVTKYEEQVQCDDNEMISIPLEFVSLVDRSLRDSHDLIKKHVGECNVEEILPVMFPDICIVNFYTTNGKLGLHQDRDESRDSLRRGLPVVSFSVGDSAKFLYGDRRDINQAESVILHSGDVLIFGGKSRHIYHGVSSIFPNSAPPALLEQSKLRPGRLNLTFRQF